MSNQLTPQIKQRQAVECWDVFTVLESGIRNKGWYAKYVCHKRNGTSECRIADERPNACSVPAGLSRAVVSKTWHLSRQFPPLLNYPFSISLQFSIFNFFRWSIFSFFVPIVLQDLTVHWENTSNQSLQLLENTFFLDAQPATATIASQLQKVL